MNRQTAVLASISALLAFAVPVHARLIKWTLQDVTLVGTTVDDIGLPSFGYGETFTASGSFLYDALSSRLAHHCSRSSLRERRNVSDYQRMQPCYMVACAGHFHG